VLDEEAYRAYSPVYLSISYAMTFTLAFALTTAAVVHTILHQGERIYKTLRFGKSEEDDIHMKLMRQYSEVPDWYVICRPDAQRCSVLTFIACRWFGAFLIVTFIFGVVAVEVRSAALPVATTAKSIRYLGQRYQCSGLRLVDRHSHNARVFFPCWIPIRSSR
jgi:hypothetical protein